MSLPLANTIDRSISPMQTAANFFIVLPCADDTNSTGNSDVAASRVIEEALIAETERWTRKLQAEINVLRQASSSLVAPVVACLIAFGAFQEMRLQRRRRRTNGSAQPLVGQTSLLFRTAHRLSSRRLNRSQSRHSLLMQKKK